MILSQESLKEVLAYSKRSGIFRWKTARSQQKVGAIAGSFDKDGYRVIRVFSQNYRAHRLAWFYVLGIWPKQIDHKDTQRDNNRWNNLREATHSQNHANQRLHCDSRTKMKGVTKRKGYQRWRARIVVQGKEIHLGLFSTPELAHTAYIQAASVFFGDFARAK